MHSRCSNGDTKHRDPLVDGQTKDESRKEVNEEEEDGDDDEEKSLRIIACDLIQNAGILLKLPQVALATAQMLLHRIYHITDYIFDKHPPDVTAMACLFLAAKIEEYPRKARDVIDVFTHVIADKLRRDLILSQSEFKRLRSEVITTEALLLKKLGFNLLSNYPHKMIVTFYHAIVNTLDPDHNVWRERDNRLVIQLAWNYCNDSLRLDVFTRFTKEAVACACVEMACEDAALSFPRSTDGRHWYSLFVASDLEVVDSIRLIRALYARPQVDPNKIRRFLYLSGKI